MSSNAYTMHILVDNSGYRLRNMGDVAMLQMGEERLRTLLDQPQLSILTADQELLARYLGGGTPIAPDMRKRWQFARFVPIGASWLPARCCSVPNKVVSGIRRRWPRLVSSFGTVTTPSVMKSRQSKSEFVALVRNADAVVVTGGGFLTDQFLRHANDVLDTLELAQAFCKPTALFSQGIGPLTCTATLARMSRILPKTRLIGLREKKLGPALLQSLGVPGELVRYTGDDAIELARRHTPSALGSAIGVNVRVARYSAISATEQTTLQQAIQSFLAGRDVKVIPIPVSFYERENDYKRICEMLTNVSQLDTQRPEDTPDAVVRQAGRCRLVIAASYHAAVFALSQGVPAIGLAQSQYYADKFTGLADQFGEGCEVVNLADPKSAERLLERASYLFDMAELLRPRLLSAADSQIDESRAAYHYFKQTMADQCIRRAI